jgi:hypothetical protein
MNTTNAYEAAVVEGYGNYVACVLMLSYFIALPWVAMNWGNRPGAQPWTTIGMIVAPRPSTTGWRRIGDVAFSPSDVNPPILQKSPLYERTYPSGKKAQRFWDDVTEEWIYTSAYPRDAVSG